MAWVRFICLSGNSTTRKSICCKPRRTRPPHGGDGPSVIACVARKWILGGRVQGVGYRPFVYRVAHRCGVQGWVRNCAGEVEILAQGAPELLQRFGHALLTEAPPLARPRILSELPVAPEPTEDFQIRGSEAARHGQIH